MAAKRPRPQKAKTMVVEPGQALFIPVGWWHHVRSLDVAISFSLTNFHYRNDFGAYCPGAIGS